jgi:Putative transposase
MSPLEFMQRLAALVPRPRLHLIRFHGVLAPNAKSRSEIIPSPVEQATEPACGHAQAQGAPARMSWARLLKRVFDIDIDHCPSGKRFNRENILRARVGGMAYNIPAA